MERIKIGQIGVCHEHAGAKMDALRKMPEVFEIVGVVDDRQTAAARFAGGDLRPYEGLHWLTEEELFHTPGLRAVVVETPNLDLVPTALRCLECGLPMHMDKPGGDDPVLFRKLLEGCKARKLPFQMGYMFRANPAFQWCLKAVRAGWLGDIFEVQANMSHDYGGEEYQQYIGNFRGGIVFNLGCHLLDFVVALLGRPKNVVSILKSAPGDPDQIRNNGLCMLEYQQATATLRACSREIGGLERRRLKLCGTKGSIELSPLERFDGQPLLMSLVLKEGNPEYVAGTHTVNFGIRNDRYVEQLQEFSEMIRGNVTNPYSYEHDLLVHEVVLSTSGYTTWR